MRANCFQAHAELLWKQKNAFCWLKIDLRVLLNDVHICTVIVSVNYSPCSPKRPHLLKLSAPSWLSPSLAVHRLLASVMLWSQGLMNEGLGEKKALQYLLCARWMPASVHTVWSCARGLFKPGSENGLLLECCSGRRREERCTARGKRIAF